MLAESKTISKSLLLIISRKISKSDEKKRQALKKARKEEKDQDEEKKEEDATKQETAWDTITFNTLVKVTGLPEPKKARFECEVCLSFQF